MHSSRMWTARSFTLYRSHCICQGGACVACMPPTTHASLPHTPPLATHAPHHACPPHMPPRHACPPPCTPPAMHAPLPHTSPATHAPCHAYPLPCTPLPRMPPPPLPMERQTLVKTLFASGNNHLMQKMKANKWNGCQLSEKMCRQTW